MTHRSNRHVRQVLVLLSVPAALALRKRNVQLHLRRLTYQLPLPTNKSTVQQLPTTTIHDLASERDFPPTALYNTYYKRLPTITTSARVLSTFKCTLKAILTSEMIFSEKASQKTFGSGISESTIFENQVNNTFQSIKFRTYTPYNLRTASSTSSSLFRLAPTTTSRTSSTR